MGLHKRVPIPPTVPRKNAAEPWQPAWPNPADVPYNYANLIDRVSTTGLADVTAHPDAANRRIAIIGAGYGGLTAARELYRCGFSNITIYEATDRLGGRGYTVLPKRYDGEIGNGSTPFELGAMRIPFFNDGSTEGPPNCVMQHYVLQYGVQSTPFPDPGSNGILAGIYMNEGFGPIPDPSSPPSMLMWRPEPGNEPPPDEALAEIYGRWSAFAERVTSAAQPVYGNTPEWFDLWHKIVTAYEQRNFRDVALLAPRTDGAETGDFGGLGLTVEQAELFYTIGAGDGSWGAFFDISALYPIRTLLFGYGAPHHLFGCVNFAGKVDEVSSMRGENFADSGNRLAQAPLFLGVASICDMHFFSPVRSAVAGVDGTSLYYRMLQDRNKADGFKLFTSNPVRKIDLNGSDGYHLTAEDGIVRDHDVIIFTQPGWSAQMNIDINADALKRIFYDAGGTGQWQPYTAWHGMKMSHNITSAKVFFKLRNTYWEGTTLPQVVVTDTFLQDVYGYKVDKGFDGRPTGDPGVLLCSYVWEDDANKMLSAHTPEDDRKLAAQCLARLDGVLERAGLEPMSPYVDAEYEPLVWHWAEQPFYRSCAKLYRAGSFDWNYAQLTWNQNHAAERNVYFSGEFASLEGGWIEPALRGALDCVVRLVQHSIPARDLKSVFHDLPMIENYIHIPDWSPSKT